MKILIYLEPWIDHARPQWRDSWIYGWLAPLHERFRHFKDHECIFVHGDAQTEIVQKMIFGYFTRTAVITQPELRAVFPDYYAAALGWYNDDAPPERSAQMQELMRAKLDGFTPDVIVTLFTSVPFLKKMFPDALVLHGDCACFSRAPFFYQWTFDPCGMLRNGYLAKHGREIAAAPLPEVGRKFLALFRKKYCDRLLKKQNPFTRAELMGGKEFRHLVLLPLHVSGTFAFNGNSKFHTQWDMLCHVLDHTPHDIGVVVTEHLDFERTLTPEVLAYLRRTYPHFIHMRKFEDYGAVSQYLLQHVDAVAAVATSLCLQALLWRKPVCALGDSHINAFADVVGIEGLEAFLADGVYRNKDNLLYFLLSRYNIPVAEAYLWNPVWLEDQFTRWLEHYRSHGADVDFFPPIDDPFRLLKYHLRTAVVEIRARDPDKAPINQGGASPPTSSAAA